jgi:opacity protein-like surface antigen
MKRILSLGAIGVFLAFSSTPALAAEGMYLSAKLGLSAPSDSDLSYSSGETIELSYDNGFGLGVALGYQLPMFRLEGEIAYRANDMDEVSYLGESAKVNGDVSILSLMGNGYYDFANATAFTPYVGVGLGMAKIDATIDAFSWDDDDTVVAYQIMVGGNFALTKQISLDAEYRYFGCQDPEFDAGDGYTSEAEVRSHNLSVGIRILF